MKDNVSNSSRLFVDRPMSESFQAGHGLPASSLFSADEPDFTEAAVRLFLMVCLVASLLLSAVEMGGPAKAQTLPHLQLPIATVCVPAPLH